MRDRHAGLGSIKNIIVLHHIDYLVFILDFILMPRVLLHFTKSTRALMHAWIKNAYIPHP